MKKRLMQCIVIIILLCITIINVKDLKIIEAKTSQGKFTPIGWLDRITDDIAYGWACDQDDYKQPIDIHFYVDGPAGTGKFIATVKANKIREKAVGDICGGNRNHGFQWTIPESLKDNKKHTIYAHMINYPEGTSGSLNPVTQGSPISYIKPKVFMGVFNLKHFIAKPGMGSEYESWLSNGLKWDTLQQNLNGNGVNIIITNIEGALGVPREGWGAWSTPENMKKFVDTLRDNNIAVSIEDGFTARDNLTIIDTNAGENAARFATDVYLKNWKNAGGKIDYVTLDGIINWFLISGKNGQVTGLTVDQAAQEVIDYMKTFNSVYPEAKFYHTIGLPNFIYKGTLPYRDEPSMAPNIDYYDVIKILSKKAREKNAPLIGYIYDAGWDYTEGTANQPEDFRVFRDPSKTDWWARLKMLEDQVEGEGLVFGVYVNTTPHTYKSNVLVKDCSTPAALQTRLNAEKIYRERTLAYYEKMKQKGITPGVYIPESWFFLCTSQYDGGASTGGGFVPTKTLPESYPYSEAAIANEIISRVKRDYKTFTPNIKYELTDQQKKAKSQGKFIAPVAGVGAVVAIIAGVVGLLVAIGYVGYKKGWWQKILKR